ncbi:helicase-related protein [Niallia oryzisoli]|uniref:helicase-related protein n=1 Tax=Niallia oryzisoli TaxID=1737571 RepID=UPI003735A3A9
MADFFSDAGIPTVALFGNWNAKVRCEAQDQLVRGELTFIFFVSLTFNEGINIPKINKILFIQSTESLTVILQQLGRGLKFLKEKNA